jgi:hypothetical protein
VIVERMYPSSGVESFQGWVFSIVQFVTAWFLGDLQKRRLAYTARLEALTPSSPASRNDGLAGRWPRSGGGSPASCTTSSPTP